MFTIICMSMVFGIFLGYSIGCDSKYNNQALNLMEEKERLKEENERIKEEDKELKEENERLKEENEELKEENKRLKLKERIIGLLKDEITELKEENERLKEEIDLNNFSITDIEEKFKQDLATNEQWQELYDKQVAISKEMVKNKLACTCDTSWKVDGSASKGKKMTEDGIKIALMSFDTIVDRACNYVTKHNVDKWAKKVRLAYYKINRLNSVNKIVISESYLDSKLAELFIIHKWREAKQEEKERAKEIRRKAAEERREKEILDAEERKIQLEIDKQREIEEQARKIIKQQLEEYNKALEELKSKGEEVSKLENIINELEEKIAKSEENQELVESNLIEQIVEIQEKKETLQSGFVYVISNYGAFGENVFKIGVTRRVDPLERVDELGNASVPFKFSVHTIIPSDKAFKLEHDLHKRLRRYRVNLVNSRKEFFNIEIRELYNILREFVPDIEFDFNVSEQQYIESKALRNNPEAFENWINTYNEVSGEEDEEKQYKKLGIVDASVINNKDYTRIEEYDEYFNKVADVVDGMSSKPVMRVTKYYVAVYMQLENNMKKVVTFYKSGDGKNINSFSIKGYEGEETKGSRKSIKIADFNLDTYEDYIVRAANEADNDLIDICSINI